MFDRTSHECDVTIRDGKLITNNCEEVHLFKPFSNENSGAMSVIRQKLSFLTDTKSGEVGEDFNFDRRESLAFGHDHRRTDSVIVYSIVYIFDKVRTHHQKWTTMVMVMMVVVFFFIVCKGVKMDLCQDPHYDGKSLVRNILVGMGSTKNWKL